MNKKEDKDKVDVKFTVKVKEETFMAMAVIRENDSFNWSAYLRACIDKKINESKQK
ncbi:hypothetical protein QZN10_39700 [Burkholderia contaminans]|jgi:hypothetical protein|uniref:hypothetical protein n=1 Tax=Pseudomonadota TaxID=1224 RepID=UPI000AA22B6A|nr:hypothetical protein [Burkholderia contaminans]MDN8026747.1 hypothetical protein [Burkholderia contaminans]